MLRKMSGDAESLWKNPGLCMTTISFSKRNFGSSMRNTADAAEMSERMPSGIMSQTIKSGRNWAQAALSM